MRLVSHWPGQLLGLQFQPFSLGHDGSRREESGWLDSYCCLVPTPPPKPPSPLPIRNPGWCLAPNQIRGQQERSRGWSAKREVCQGHFIHGLPWSITELRRPIPPDPSCLGLGERRGQELPGSQKSEGSERAARRGRRERGDLSLMRDKGPSEERSCPETRGTKQLLTLPQLKLLISRLTWAGMGSFK